MVLHVGTHRADPATAAMAVPIYQTTSHQFSLDRACGKPGELGKIYTRIINPTQAVRGNGSRPLRAASPRLVCVGPSRVAVRSPKHLSHAGENVVCGVNLSWRSAVQPHCGDRFAISTAGAAGYRLSRAGLGSD